MDDLQMHVEQYWEQRPFTDTDSIVVGVSGGADSMALLHHLCHYSKHPVEKMLVVCVDHQLRPESSAEAAFVAQTAAEWGVQSVIRPVDISELSSIEEAGRDARYKVFQEICQRFGAVAVLTAHHADDQIETVLINLLRGSGVSGLRGMRPISQRIVSGEPLLIFRPFLAVWRSEILTYVQTYQIPYMEDASNEDVRFLRNRLRHELVPQLMTYNAQVKQHMWQTAELLQDHHEGWQQFITAAWHTAATVGEQFVRFDSAYWKNQHVSIQRALLRRAIQQLANLQGVTLDHIEMGRGLIAKGEHGAELHFPHQLKLQIVYDTAVLSYQSSDVEDLYDLPLLEAQQAYELIIPCDVPLTRGWWIKIERLGAINLSDVTQNQNRWEAFLSLNDQVLTMRPRLAGERFRPLGMVGTIKVKDVMINEKVPAAVRSRWPIIANRDGVVWLTGHRLAQHAAVDAESRPVIHIEVYKKIKSEET